MNVPVVMQLLFLTAYLVTENKQAKCTRGRILGCSGKVRRLTHLSLTCAL